MPDDFISGREFTTFRDELARHHDHVNSQLSELLTLVRLQNGRIYKQEASIAVIEREISAIKAEDVAIDKIVLDIQQNGCHQYREHEKAVEVLAGAGVLPNTDGPLPERRAPFSVKSLSTKQKAAAGAGIAALLIPALSDLFQFGHALVEWLRSLS